MDPNIQELNTWKKDVNRTSPIVKQYRVLEQKWTAISQQTIRTWSNKQSNAFIFQIVKKKNNQKNKNKKQTK